MPDAQVLRFIKAAAQRLNAADTLLADSQYLDATYMAGYVVECSLKALLLSYIPVPDRPDFVRDCFRGSTAHDFEFLMHQLRQRGINMSSEIRKMISRADRIWSVDLRYDSGHGRAKDAKFLRDAGEAILSWVKRSVTWLQP